MFYFLLLYFMLFVSQQPMAATRLLLWFTHPVLWFTVSFYTYNVFLCYCVYSLFWTTYTDFIYMLVYRLGTVFLVFYTRYNRDIIVVYPNPGRVSPRMQATARDGENRKWGRSLQCRPYLPLFDTVLKAAIAFSYGHLSLFSYLFLLEVTSFCYVLGVKTGRTKHWTQ